MKNIAAAALFLLLAVSVSSELPRDVAAPRFRGSLPVTSLTDKDHLLTDGATEAIKAIADTNVVLADISGPVCARIYNNPIRSWAGQTATFQVDYHCVHTAKFDMSYAGSLTVNVDPANADKLAFEPKEWGIVAWNEAAGILTIKGKVKFADTINVNADAIGKAAQQITYSVAIPQKGKNDMNGAGVASLHLLARAAPAHMEHVPVCAKSIADTIEVHPGDTKKTWTTTFHCKGNKVRFERIAAKIAVHHTTHMKFAIEQPTFHVTGPDSVDVVVHGSVTHDKDESADHGFRVVEARVSFAESQEVVLSVPFFMPPNANVIKAEETTEATVTVDKSGFEEIKLNGDASGPLVDEFKEFHSGARMTMTSGAGMTVAAVVLAAALL